VGLLLLACTRANPAYHITVQEEDAAPDESSPVEPDAAVTLDRAGSDLALPPDAATPPPEVAPPPPDAATPPPDTAPPPDLATPAPDLAPDSGVSSAGLVAHWRLDETSGTTVSDATGNGNTGTAMGGPTWVTGGFSAARFPNPGALQLDGVNDYVELTNKSIPAAGAAKSLCAWFKTNDAADIPIRNLVALINDTTDVGIQLGLDEGRVAAWFYGAPGPLIFAAMAANGNWHLAVYTFDGKTHRIYYDGHLEMSRDMVPKAGTINHARLGTYQVPDEMFDGIIDDVRIYSRALSDAEVAALWSGQ